MTVKPNEWIDAIITVSPPLNTTGVMLYQVNLVGTNASCQIQPGQEVHSCTLPTGLPGKLYRFAGRVCYSTSACGEKLFASVWTPLKRMLNITSDEV